MPDIKIKFTPINTPEGGIVTLEAGPESADPTISAIEYAWRPEAGTVSQEKGLADGSTGGWTHQTQWNTTGLPARWYAITADYIVHTPAEKLKGSVTAMVEVTARSPKAEDAGNIDSISPKAPVPVVLQRGRSSIVPKDLILSMIIRESTKRLSFKEYASFIDNHLCRHGGQGGPSNQTGDVDAGPGTPRSFTRSPFVGLESYRRLKAMTEVFLLDRTGVMMNFDELLSQLDWDEESARAGAPLGGKDFSKLWDKYLEKVNGTSGALPYLALIQSKLPNEALLPMAGRGPNDGRIDCSGILENKLGMPCFLELFWNYWHEEGMLVQTLNRISQRFQNVRGPGLQDPLANLELDPLRPLGSILWGYIQDEQHRLSVVRRAYEYEHEYGFSLRGKAVARVRAAERRSKFLEAFHNLLHECLRFFRQSDDTTVVADGFPVLNSLKETHYLLAQGAHNQFGDMPSTARQEMLIQQWLLARPEMREFLGGRTMAAYPEPWMDRVDAMKALHGWTDVSVVHFHNLAVFGEQILLSVRYGAWSVSNDPAQAASWANYWRAEIQGYIHAYRAVTGVDLTGEAPQQPRLSEAAVEPSVLLRNRLAAQRRR